MKVDDIPMVVQETDLEEKEKISYTVEIQNTTHYFRSRGEAVRFVNSIGESIEIIEEV